MKTEIKKAQSVEFEPFEVVIQVETINEATILLRMVQHELHSLNELRVKVEAELIRQNWSI